MEYTQCGTEIAGNALLDYRCGAVRATDVSR